MPKAEVTKRHRELAAVSCGNEASRTTLHWIKTGVVRQPFNSDLVTVAEALADLEAETEARSAERIAALEKWAEQLLALIPSCPTCGYQPTGGFDAGACECEP